jgi:hypothetical protein
MRARSQAARGLPAPSDERRSLLFYGTLRVSVLLPTVLVLSARKPLSERGLFFGILGLMVVGLPLQTLGQWARAPLLLSGGSLVTVLTSGVVLVLFTAIERRAGPR